MLQKFSIQINAVLLNLLFTKSIMVSIKNIKQQLFSALIIRHVFFAANQIPMQLLMQNAKSNAKSDANSIKMEIVTYNLNIISQYYCYSCIFFTK